MNNKSIMGSIQFIIVDKNVTEIFSFKILVIDLN